VGPSGNTLGILVVQKKSGAAERRELAARSLLLGRTPGNDIRLDSGTVSERHARLDHRDGFWVLTDLGSRNGTYLNGRKIEGPTPLRKDDMIYIGDFILRMEPPPPTRHGTMPMPGRPTVEPASLVLIDGNRQKPISLGAKLEITIGRDPSHDVVLPEPRASSTHCLLRVTAEGLVLEDLSSSGTFVHGFRLGAPRILSKGDVITFGHPGLPPQCVRIVVVTGPLRPDGGGPRGRGVRATDTERPEEDLELGPGLAPHAAVVRRFLQDAVEAIVGPGEAGEPRWKNLKQPLGRCLLQIGEQRGYDASALQQWYQSDEYKTLRVELNELVKRRVGFEPPPPSIRRRSRPPQGRG
jgi:pSer/pThr/pTyr-binding forkhead associated (FHA) protein